jgi:hypothetical protein
LLTPTPKQTTPNPNSTTSAIAHTIHLHKLTVEKLYSTNRKQLSIISPLFLITTAQHRLTPYKTMINLSLPPKQTDRA